MSMVHKARFYAVLPDLSIFVIIFGLFLLLKSFSFHYAVSDENIYFYDAWLMYRGEYPYRDFFFAHPPLHLLSGWLMMELQGGFDFVWMKALPLFPTLVSAILVYRIVYRASNRIGAVITLLLLLFSHDLLRASSHWTAVNWAVMWMVGSYYLLLSRKMLFSGLLLALGISTALYIVPVAMILMVMALVDDKKRSRYFFGGLLFGLLMVNLPFIILAPQGYLNDVFLYHLQKVTTSSGDFYREAQLLLFHNFFLFSAPLFALLLLLRLRTLEEEKGTLRTLLKIDAASPYYIALWSLLLFVVYLLFLSMLHKVFHYYFIVLFPFGALLGGLFVGRSLDALSRRPQWPYLLLLLLYLSGGMVIPGYLERGLSYYEKNHDRHLHYEKPVSLLPSQVESRLLTLLYERERVVGQDYSTWQYYLWHESRTLEVTDAIVTDIEEHSSHEVTIYGDSTTVPLIALLAERAVSANLVDTNYMRFRAEPTLMVQHMKQLLTLPEGWVLINPRRGIGRDKVFRHFLAKNYHLVERYQSRYFGTYLLWRKNVPEE